jgi:formamidopyrimidine-DNA glycosylase
MLAADRQGFAAARPMPELPDVDLYCGALASRIAGHVLEGIDIVNPFVLRTAVPDIATAAGRTVRGVHRLGKRIVIDLDADLHAGLHLVLHLMIAGRLRWLDRGAKGPGRITLARLQFANGTLAFTEAGSKRRASLHLVEGVQALRAFDMGGLEIFQATASEFAARVTSENHTLKRALTDQRLISGIGNAYSDEILHRARLSPLAMTQKLDAAAVARLWAAARDVLGEWRARLASEAGDAFPEKVTAFRPQMAVHGKFGQPCPDCGAPVQRIVYAENECDYCARCQNNGVILADRAMSRLLHKSWPRSIDDLA